MIGLIDIGGTKLLASVTDGSGRPGPSIRRPTVRDNGDPIAELCCMLDELRQGTPLTGIGMSVVGPFDRERGALVNPPNVSKLWWNLDLRGKLGAVYDCPVYLENDANCAALAEANYGAAKGHRTVVYYTVSTGIGTGLVRDGALLIGRHDTEGGHQVLWPEWVGGPPCPCGGHGCLEALASGRALFDRFGKHAEDITDPAVWKETGRWLGLAIVNTTALLDPDVVVLGGGVINEWEKFSDALMATVKEHLHLQPAPQIVRAQLGEDRNLWGALTLIPESTHESPHLHIAAS